MRLVERTLERTLEAKGQTMTEYALILATVAIVLSSLYTTAGAEVQTLVDRVGALF